MMPQWTRNAASNAKTKPAVARLMVPILYVMDNCGFPAKFRKHFNTTRPTTGTRNADETEAVI